MLEQGLQVFNGIFKRIYRAFRGELRKLYALNSLYMDETEYFEYLDTVQTVARADYQAESKSLIPAADPNAVANKEKMVKAQMLAERAAMVPGYNPIVVERRLLDAMDIPDAAEAYPLTQDEQGNPQLVFQPAPNPEFEIKRAEEQRRTLEAQDRGETNRMKVASQMAVDESTVILNLAKASETASKPEIERMKMLLEEMRDRRKSVIEAVKVDGANNARTTETVGGQSGNGSAA
jgi:hypothetical protein